MNTKTRKVNINRYEHNPILTPADVSPLREDFTVECVFNAGVATYQDETILLLRVAERPVQANESVLRVPVLKEVDGHYQLTIHEMDKSDSRYDFSDPRKVKQKDIDTYVYLTSMSHLRLARSKNGVDFEVDDHAFIFPDNQYEAFGTEDSRITFIDGWYYINYTAVSEKGITTALARTKDFVTVERLGIIFTTENRDVTIFPEKINGHYFALHRPVPKQIGRAQMWTASSPDLLHWGKHEFLMGVGEGWQSQKIGGGAVPFRTEKGWIEIYHGADETNRYTLGAVLLDLEDPTKILAKTSEPILEPEAVYEVEGFFGNVVFSCGVVAEGNNVKIYYGGADNVMALAEITVDEIYKCLGV
ncbi:glycoside hydrolase family 130 protein [Neobacillus sp. MM2021_6]|uniref:glycoside hydrolase family 130 protein n=1 Tax=Bacillaceae TaxID=186817 RepID=UPI00140E86FC|nr:MULTISPECIES: glycoside hydrolase family 130 protein [Bacillaceae]MBO0959904.1 glycoside hydrolase family 130 protein [Neobacillus sp. MM2021_6]NHC18852.1 glycosidase [Bacillus sp. MM2020_4]